MRIKVSFFYDFLPKGFSNYYLYDFLRNTLLENNRFPTGLFEIGNGYIICDEDEKDHFIRKIMSVPSCIEYYRSEKN